MPLTLWRIHLYTHTHTECAISKNAPYTRALLLQSSMIVYDMIPSLMLTDAHLWGSSYLFIYLSIYLRQVYLLMGLKDMMAHLHLLIQGSKKQDALSVCNIYTWMNKRRKEDRVYLFYLGSSSWNSYSFLVMEEWYGPFSYLALIPMV